MRMGSSGQRTAALTAAGALALGATAGLLLVGDSHSSASRGRPVDLFQWKPYKGPSNVFDNFDGDFKVYLCSYLKTRVHT